MNNHADPLNLIICGIGGQGNILISRLLGRTLTDKGYLVTIGETFGAAQRGGAVFSSINKVLPRIIRNNEKKALRNTKRPGVFHKI